MPMKRELIFMLAPLVMSTSCFGKSDYNCTCTDLMRDSGPQNQLTFSSDSSKCSKLAGKYELKDTVSGSGECTVSGKSYPCQYKFTKVHPTTCTYSK